MDIRCRSLNILPLAIWAFMALAGVWGLEYPYAPYNAGIMDPQLTGWPITAAETSWVLRPEYERKPGHEAHQHLPTMWAVTPTAGYWKPQEGSASNPWLDHHATLVEQVRARRNGIDVALIGDSITEGWGGGWNGQPFNAPWRERFGRRTTVNLGIGGDRIENILWRLEHGALDGASPRVAVLHIGVNNAPLVTANGMSIASVAEGLRLCVSSLHERCPRTVVVVMKIIPAFEPGSVVHEDIRRINAAIDGLDLARVPLVRVLDLWSEFTLPDGSLKKTAYSDDHLHLSSEGYAIWAAGLQPLVDGLPRGTTTAGGAAP